MNREELKSRVLALALEGRAIGTRIRAAAGRERDRLWNEKRAVGRRARCVLLAYAYVREVPYARVEPRTAIPLSHHALADGWFRELGLVTSGAAVAGWLDGVAPQRATEVAMT